MKISENKITATHMYNLKSTHMTESYNEMQLQ